MKKKDIGKYLKNTLWMLFDKGGSLLIKFIISILLARYLGPDQFGIYSYAISMSAIFAAAGQMGLQGIVVLELVKKPNEQGVILGTIGSILFGGMLFAYILLILYAVFFEWNISENFWAIIIMGAVLVVRPLDILDFWFQSITKSKFVTIARLISLTLQFLLVLLFIKNKIGTLSFVALSAFQTILSYILIYIFYRFQTEINLRKWSASLDYAKSILRKGGLIYIGSIFAILYLKIDQVMLRWLSGNDSVGIYSVAVQLSEAWYFIPTAIVASIFPKLIEIKSNNTIENFNFRFQQLLDLLFILSISIAIFVTLISGPVITLLYGVKYTESAYILNIHIWASIFIFMRAAFSKWILIEEIYVFSVITQGAGALINIILNYFLISRYGAIGAAYSTLISYAVASYFSLLIYRRTREVFFMMSKSLTFFIRYIKVLI